MIDDSSVLCIHTYMYEIAKKYDCQSCIRCLRTYFYHQRQETTHIPDRKRNIKTMKGKKKTVVTMCARTKKRWLLLLEVLTGRIKEAPPLPPAPPIRTKKEKEDQDPTKSFRKISDRDHDFEGTGRKKRDRGERNGSCCFFKRKIAGTIRPHSRRGCHTSITAKPIQAPEKGCWRQRIIDAHFPRRPRTS